MEQLLGQRVLVLGLGASGRSAAAYCAARGANVTAADERPARQLEGLESLPSSVALRAGEPFPDAADFDLVVPSPGVAPERYRARARRVLGDVELAFRALSVPIVAVTGTNGKSTTARLVEAMLRAAGLRALAAGNLGDPALGLLGRAIDVAVLEVSSFQLETTEAFRPRVSVLLNLSEDHLDRHASFERYASAKRRIFACQQPEDFAVVNGDDVRVMALAEGIRPRIRRFSRSTPSPEGAWWDGSAMVLRAGTRDLRLHPEGPQLERGHQRENALAALLAAFAAGADPSKAIHALASFRGLPHRSERVRTVGGVDWINDSKATNPGAAMATLASQVSPVIWIAGGKDKGLSFDSLAEAARGKVRTALLIGEAAEKIARALTGRVAFECVDDLEKAIARAQRLAEPGDAVVLAPACASFDQFANFEERGERFRQLVLGLTEVNA